MNEAEILELVARYTSWELRPRVSLDARLLHDLLILGDDIQELWAAFDPDRRIDMTGFVLGDHFPSELGFDAFAITALSVFRREHLVTRRYKPFRVGDMMELSQTRRWWPS